MGALVQLLPHHHRLRPATWDSAPSSSCPWLPDRCPISTHHQPLLALRPAEWLASRPGPPPSRWQRLLRPSLPHRRSPHGEVGYHYAAVWTLAAAGLAPAGRVLLWAATSLRVQYPTPALLERRPTPYALATLGPCHLGGPRAGPWALLGQRPARYTPVIRAPRHLAGPGGGARKHARTARVLSRQWIAAPATNRCRPSLRPGACDQTA